MDNETALKTANLLEDMAKQSARETEVLAKLFKVVEGIEVRVQALEDRCRN